MAQMRFDWLEGAFRQLHDPVVDDVLFVGPQSLGFVFQLVDSAQLEAKGDNCLVQRVVGSMYHSVSRRLSGTGDLQAGVTLYERIYVTDVDASGQPEALHAMENAVDFDRSWAWERQRPLMALNALGESWQQGGPTAFVKAMALQGHGLGQDPGWTHLDLKFKRRLKDREVLVYDCQYTFPPGAGQGFTGDVILCAPRLRVGVIY